MEQMPNSHSPRGGAERESWEKFAIEKYLTDLGLTLSELKDKQVLDIGAGGGAFVRAAQEAGAFAVAFDMSSATRNPETIRVAGNAVRLPFKDEAFDPVVSHAALPHFVVPETGVFDETNGEDAHEARFAAIAEAVRVLKPGGEVRLGPVPRDERPDIFKRNESIEFLIDSLRNDPTLEVAESLLRRNLASHNTEGKKEHSSDSYRVVIRKRSIDTEKAAAP